MIKTTVVTAYFNLSKLKDYTPSTRSPDFYQKNGMATICLPYPMVIFCDEETLPMIQEMRKQCPKEVPTEYIVKNITEYNHYSDHYPIVENNRKTIVRPVDSRNTISYFLTTSAKPLFLLLAKQRNFFKTPFYAWIDFGGNHVMKNVATMAPKMLDNPNPKISVCYIHYRSKEELKDIRSFVSEGRCGISGCIISADKDYIDRYYNLSMQIFQQQLFLGVGHADEQISTYCYNAEPDLFTLYYGDYYSTLTNYHEPLADIDAIRYYFVRNCLHAGRKDLAEDAIRRVLDTLAKKSELNSNELEIREEFLRYI